MFVEDNGGQHFLNCNSSWLGWWMDSGGVGGRKVLSNEQHPLPCCSQLYRQTQGQRDRHWGRVKQPESAEQRKEKCAGYILYGNVTHQPGNSSASAIGLPLFHPQSRSVGGKWINSFVLRVLFFFSWVLWCFMNFSAMAKWRMGSRRGDRRKIPSRTIKLISQTIALAASSIVAHSNSSADYIPFFTTRYIFLFGWLDGPANQISINKDLSRNHCRILFGPSLSLYTPSTHNSSVIKFNVKILFYWHFHVSCPYTEERRLDEWRKDQRQEQSDWIWNTKKDFGIYGDCNCCIRMGEEICRRTDNVAELKHDREKRKRSRRIEATNPFKLTR